MDCYTCVETFNPTEHIVWLLLRLFSGSGGMLIGCGLRRSAWFCPEPASQHHECFVLNSCSELHVGAAVAIRQSHSTHAAAVAPLQAANFLNGRRCGTPSKTAGGCMPLYLLWQ